MALVQKQTESENNISLEDLLQKIILKIDHLEKRMDEYEKDFSKS